MKHYDTKLIRFCLFFVSAMFPFMPLHAKATYIGLKSGWVYAGNACESHNIACDSDSNAIGIFAGYNINHWLDVEIGYDYLGKINASYPALGDNNIVANYSAEIRGFDFGLKPNFVIAPGISLFSKIGAMAWQMDVAGDEVGYQHTAKSNGLSPILGAGLNFDITRNISAQTEYQWLNRVGGESTGGSELNIISVGIKYKFNTATNTHSSPAPEITPITNSSYKKKVITLSDDSLSNDSFEIDSSKLNNEMKYNLDLIVDILQKNKNATITIEGHTDNQGTEGYNQILSEHRAIAANNYIVAKGIAASRIYLVGKGEVMPITENSTTEGRAKNRRIVINIKH